MYKIRVKAKKYWKSALVEEVHTATVWAVDYLRLDISPIPIHIKLCGPTTTFGDCVDLDHKIVVRLFSSPEWLGTLFHELTHAQQYLYGRLQLECDHAYWNGELFQRKDFKYSNEPWEVEARKIESKMQKKFLTF